MIQGDGQISGDIPSLDPGTEHPDELDDRFLSHLIDFDEAMASGTTPLPLDDTELPAEQAAQLRAIQECLVLLARAGRIRDPDTHRPSATPISSEDRAMFEALQSGTGDSIRPDAIQSGGRFGRFELVCRLGRGGTGVVYLANDPILHRQVALKIPLPSWLYSDELRQRFLREGEAAARLSHPNIVAVYEVNEFGPVCYIASEYCSGPSLAAFIDSRETPVSSRAAAKFVAILADAMQHTHARGVLHRDLKPSNIFLVPVTTNAELGTEASEDISKFTPKIGDFGLAKLQQQVGSETRSGAVLGTLLYMSPEQAKGCVHEITVRTDIYALGAILYALLTGEPPHRGATDFETLQMITTADPSPPGRFRADSYSDLNAICLKCLDKNPLKRYTSAAALAEDLRRFLANRPTIARELAPLPLAFRWVRRYPARAALLAVSVAALAIVIGGALTYNAQLRVAVNHAQREATKGREFLYTRNVRLAREAWNADQIDEAIGLLSDQIPRQGQADLREFAWHYLWNECHSELSTLRGHKADVYSVTFSSDGQWLASGGKDGTVRLWNVRTGELVRAFLGHQSEVNTVVMVSETALASASDDGTVRIWDIRSGRQITILDAKDGKVFGLAASADGQLLASDGAGGRIHLWDLESGTRLWTSDAHPHRVQSLSFSPDGRSLVAGYQDGRVRWWDVEKHQMVQVERTFGDQSLSVAHSSDLPELAVASRTGFLGTYRHESQGWLNESGKVLDKKAIGIHAVAFSPRDNTLATGTRDGLIQLWNSGNRLMLWRVMPGHRSRIWSVAWSPDGRLLASAAADGLIKLWNPARTGDGRKTYPRSPAPICSIAVSADRQSIITGSMDGYLREWNRSSQQVRRISAAPGADVTAVSYLGNEDVAVANGASTGLQQWNVVSDAWTELTDLGELACSLAVSADGKLIAVGCQHSTAVLFDAETGHLRHRLKTRALDVEVLALSRDGKRLATAGVSAEIELWNTRTGQRERILLGHPNRTLCLEFSPDGSKLVSGGSDETIRIWHAASGRLLATLVGQTAPISALAISPDGRTLASGCHRPTASIELWDLVTHGKLMKFQEIPDGVTSLAFTPDGRTLIAGCGGGQLYEWSLDDHNPFPAENSPSVRVALRPQKILGPRGELPEVRPSPSESPRSVEMFQAVHDYARRAGFVTGYPTFVRGQHGKQATVQVVLLRGERAKTIQVSLDDFYSATTVPQFDYQSQAELIDDWLRRVDLWSRGKGYKGALPSYYAVHRSDEAPEFEVTLLSGPSFKRREIDLDELGDVQDVELIFRQVHSWAVKSGFVSGFPNFRISDKKLGCVLVLSRAAEIREIPTDELIFDRRQ